MTDRDFVFWLNGFFELTDSKTLNEAQTRMVKEHLALVLTKVTPTLNPEPPSPRIIKEGQYIAIC